MIPAEQPLSSTNIHLPGIMDEAGSDTTNFANEQFQPSSSSSSSRPRRKAALETAKALKEISDDEGFEEERKDGAEMGEQQSELHMLLDQAASASYLPTLDNYATFQGVVNGSIATARPPKKKAKRQSANEDGTTTKRKKANRACYTCQKAHLVCDDKRPCTRCVRKGLADSCADGVRKKAKYLADVRDDVLRSSSVEPQSLPKPQQDLLMPVAPVHLPGKMPGGRGSSISPNLGPIQISPPPLTLTQPQPQILMRPGVPQGILSATTEPMSSSAGLASTSAPSTTTGLPTATTFPLNPAASLFHSDSVNLEYAMLSRMLQQQGFQLPPTTTAPIDPSAVPSQPILRTSLPPSANSLTTRSPDVQTSAASSAAAYASVTKPYDYRQGFHYLIQYVKFHMEKPDIMRIARALAHFRPSFMALIMNLSEEDLVFMEKCFQRTLVEYEKLINCSGTPTVVWRRTGEIALVGKEFSLLTQWSREQLLGKKTYIYEVG